MAQNVGSTIVLNIDATGTSEARPAPFSFANDPLIKAGDTLSSTTPNLSTVTPEGQPALTYGTLSLSGTTWTCEVSVADTNAKPGSAYTACCRATTTGGYTVEAFIPIVIAGVGYQPPQSPPSGPATVAAGTFFGGPTASPNAAPAYRSLVATDLPTSGVAAGTYGDATHVAAVTVDAFGRATSASSTAILLPSANLTTTGVTAGSYGDSSHVVAATVDAAGRLSSLAASVYQVERFTTAGLPAPGSAGRQVLTTDNNQSVAHDNGNFWVLGGLGQYDLQDFATNANLGNGVNDDSPVFQAAWNAAAPFGGTVWVPPPKSGYIWNSGITLQGSGTATRAANWRGSTSNNNHGQIITYNGGSNTSAVTLLGVVDSAFENISICPASGLNNVVIWDYQFTSQLATSGSYCRHVKCNTVFNNNLNCIWMRMGQNGGASSAFDMLFDQCLVSDNTALSGCIAVQIGGSQAYSSLFKACSFNTCCNILCGPVCSYLTSGVTSGVSTTIPVADTLLFPSSGTISIGGVTGAYTSKSVASGPGNLNLSAAFGGTFGSGSQVSLSVSGQGVYVGNASFRFEGGTLSGNSMGYDVLLVTGGYAEISNTQCQLSAGTPRRFLQVGQGVASFGLQVYLNQVTIKGYAPPTIDSNGVMWLHYNTLLKLHQFAANRGDGTAYSASSPLIVNTGASNFGNIRFDGATLFATYPFVTNTPGWQIDYKDVQLTNSAGSVQSILSENPYAYKSVTTTYTVTTADHTIAANATTAAFPVNLPDVTTVPAGFKCEIKKTDSSTHAVTVTPNGVQTIEGASNYALSAQNKFVAIRGDGTSNWEIFGSN